MKVNVDDAKVVVDLLEVYSLKYVKKILLRISVAGFFADKIQKFVNLLCYNILNKNLEV